MISLVTNLNSLTAQENLSTNEAFQSQTIQRLTSGFRINSSGDDPAGLAIANSLRGDIAQQTQGVSNANDGISALQILDGGISNISQILDRLKVLAAQSASQTFTGDRTVLNSEFQTLLGEINRQAQSIGLNQGGQFANALSIYVGGSASDNTVSVDLSSSAVDTRSLGLGIPGSEGMAVTVGSSSVAPILADAKNTTATPGYTDFYFAGAGFSDGSKIEVSANLQGVTDLNSLAASLNAAIQVAANGSSTAAAAFKNAGISASVITDVNGDQQLSFGSSSTAFQVEPGDMMANALMGNLTVTNGVVGTTSTPLATTVAGQVPAVGVTGGPVTVQLSGGSLSAPVDLVLKAGSTTADLQAAVSNNAQLSGAGISAALASNGTITFTDSRGEAFSALATGDTNDVLGLGTFVGNGTAAADYTSISGQYNGAFGTADLEFSINGAKSVAVPPIDLSAGNARAATLGPGTAGAIAVSQGDDLQLTVDGIPQPDLVFPAASTTATDAMNQINAAAAAGGINVTASLDSSGHLQLSSNTKGANSSIEITGGTAAAELGLPLNTIYAGASQPGADIAAQLNADFQANASLQAAGLTASFSGTTLTIASSNNTYFRINPGGSSANADLGFGVAGKPFLSTLTVPSALDQPVDSDGAANISPLAFSAMAYGSDQQTLTISATDSSGALETQTLTLGNDDQGREGSSIDGAIAYINAQLQGGSSTMQQITAVKEDVGGVESINFLSSLPSFSINVGASANGNGINGGAAITANSWLAGAGRNLAIDTIAGADQALAAMTAAVGTLGSAQAVVGKGENQLGYALNLAQSEITNFSAAESSIRDADVAAEAANLTKAQILQQAGIAAMAQANTSAQAVLALLKG